MRIGMVWPYACASVIITIQAMFSSRKSTLNNRSSMRIDSTQLTQPALKIAEAYFFAFVLNCVKSDSASMEIDIC